MCSTEATGYRHHHHINAKIKSHGLQEKCHPEDTFCVYLHCLMCNV